MANVIASKICRTRKPLEFRFWEKVNKRQPSECWEWTGAKTTAGYGVIGIGGRGEGAIYAHRLSYIIANGELSDDLHILHSCDNPKCVNPAHLTAGTNFDNIVDCCKKGRRPAGTSHHQARFSVADLKEMRAMRDAGLLQRDISKRFSVNPSVVSRILNRKTYRGEP